MPLRFYRLAPEYRRSAIYAMVGLLVLAVATYWLGHIFLERDIEGTIVVCTVWCVAAMAMAIPLHWALRIDEVGVACRRWNGWDLWTWSDFASGRIEKKHPIKLVDPEKPWARSTLNLGYLAEADQEEVLHRINEHYRLPPPPPVSEKLSINFGFRRNLDMDAGELRLRIRGTVHFFSWKQVRRLSIVRVDPKRRDFAQLSLFLPDEIIELKRHDDSPMWRGASAEELNEFLLAHVPPDRVDQSKAAERPARLEDIQRQVEEWSSRVRGAQICMAIGVLAFAAIIVWSAFDVGVGKAAAMAASYLLAVPVFWGLYWSIRKELARKVAWLEEWEAEDAAARKAKW